MNCRYHFKLCIVTVALLLSQEVKGQEEAPDSDFEEVGCVQASAAHDVDHKWLLADRTWYTVIANKDAMHKALVSIYWKSIDYLTLNEITRSCMYHDRLDVTQKITTAYAYGRTGHFEVLGLDDDGAFTYQELKDNKRVGPIVHSNLTYTDNKSFAVYVCCYEDGERGIFVTSTEKELPDETLKHLEDYAVKLGFNPKYLLRLKFDNCLYIDESNDIIPSSTTASEPGRKERQSNYHNGLRNRRLHHRRLQHKKRSYETAEQSHRRHRFENY